jgi:hypothetical protein
MKNIVSNETAEPPMRSAAAEFEAAMETAGLKVPPGGVKADGKIHCCDLQGERGEGRGSYQLDLDGIPAGWFHNNRDGSHLRRWHARTGQKHTPAELAAGKEKVRLQKASRGAAGSALIRQISLALENGDARELATCFRQMPRTVWASDSSFLGIPIPNRRNGSELYITWRYRETGRPAVKRPKISSSPHELANLFDPPSSAQKWQLIIVKKKGRPLVPREEK